MFGVGAVGRHDSVLSLLGLLRHFHRAVHKAVHLSICKRVCGAEPFTNA